MGNLQTLINYHSPFSYIQDLNDQIEDEGMINHPGLGSIQLWKIKQQNQPMIFSYHVHIYEKDSNLIEFHNYRSQIVHPNILSYFACTKSKAQNIGNVCTQQLFFAYYPNNLRQKLTKQKKLPETEIWNIVEQIVNALAYLQGLNRYHGNLITESILLNQYNEIKLLDKLDQNPNYDQIKRDVYDLGIIIIEMITGRANQLNLNESIKQMAGIYSIQLLQLVGKMIQKEAALRPDFIQIQQLIKNRFKEPIILHNPFTNRSQPVFVKIKNHLQRLQNFNSNQRVVIRPQKVIYKLNYPKMICNQQSNNKSQIINSNILQQSQQESFQSQNQEQHFVSIVEYSNQPNTNKNISQVDQISNADKLTLFQSGILHNSIMWLQNSSLKKQSSVLQFTSPKQS
ncbi:unnamed protein product [Paramecium sonneborni]|uniref:Protein kinase domain-containing protein n=1 Tax=Paramecium sonneborni TaxID=65129 RepID=A0A8S1JZ42_9CILI|nr:unnamed protein product [Paramecium sonneborni]